MADRKAVIKNADMSEDMQQDAVDCASQALEKYNIEKVKRGVLSALVSNYSYSAMCSILRIILGYRCVHQEGVRQEVQPHLALHSGQKLRLVRHARNEALHLFLSRPSCNFAVQIGLRTLK
jgi:hypothetical protein